MISPRDTRLARMRFVALIASTVAALGIGLLWTRYTSAELRLARGREAIRAADFDLGEDYARILERAGRIDHAHLLRGELLRARRRPDLALEEFNKIQDSGALRLEGATQAGLCLLELKNHREAARVLEFVIAEQPDNVEAQRGLAAVAYDVGQSIRAVEHLEIVARLAPSDARPHRLMGLIYKDSAQNELSAAAYRESLARGPGEKLAEEIRLELAEVQIRLHRFSDALEVLGERESALIFRAESLRGLGRNRDAAELLDSKPNATPEWSRLRGQLLLEEAKSEAAVPHLERAAAAPADYPARLLLAQAYSAVGRTEDARKVAARAEELRKDLDAMSELSREANMKPWDAVVRLQLAEIADRIGKPHLAELWRAAAASCRVRSR